MAEFCLKCFNEMEEKNYTREDVIFSKHKDLCEGCGQEKYTIVKLKKKRKIGLLILIANLILWPIAIYLILGVFSDNKEPVTPEKYAYTMAWSTMKEQHLKVPDGAEFQPFDEVTVITDGNNTYQIRMWIKAQNAFGVKIKSFYLITVKHEPEQNQWRFIDFVEE